MKTKSTAGLGDGLGEYGEVGSVDMFGLDEFGEPHGADALWGSVIGGGVGTAAALAARKMVKRTSKLHHYSEALGFLAAGATGGLMLAFPNSRRMGWAAIATSFVTNGLRQLETSLFPSKFHHRELAAMHQHALMTDGHASEGDMHGEMAHGAAPGGFGIHTIDAGYPVPAGYSVPSGLGAYAIDAAYPVAAAPGAPAGGGFAGYGGDMAGPPSLLNAGDYGMSENPAVQQNKILGGPQLSALGAHFGSTLFSQN